MNRILRFFRRIRDACLGLLDSDDDLTQTEAPEAPILPTLRVETDDHETVGEALGFAQLSAELRLRQEERIESLDEDIHTVSEEVFRRITHLEIFHQFHPPGTKSHSLPPSPRVPPTHGEGHSR